MRVFLLLIVSALFGAAAAAEVITGATVNCRDAPGGSTVAKLTRGQTVVIEDRQGSWVRIWRPGGLTCWVSEQFVGSGEAVAGFQPSTHYSQPSARTRASVSQPSPHTRASLYGSSGKVKARKKPRKSASRAWSSPGRHITASGDCPCSSGRICIGPRGGRYCITSGGNKRYGV